MDRADPIPLAAPDVDPADERDHEERRAARDASLHRWLIACDRAAYERRHGTLDGPPETHRWDVPPKHENTMTPAQTTAFRSPCFEAEETMQPKFARRLPPLNDASQIITLNVGME